MRFGEKKAVELEKISLYLHIPFCRHRCSYCDFNTYTSLGDLKEAYADALTSEIRQVGALAGEQPLVHTLFFGGGTPSLMPPAALAKIFTAVREHFTLTGDVEISLEANPGTVDAAYLQALADLGVNRLSFGVQSANPAELALLERIHDFSTVIDSVELSRQAGFENLSLDLIYGLPGQSLSNWEKSLKAVLALGPEHLSLYCLTIEPGTPMNRWLNNGRIQLPDPDLAADQYQLAGEMLAASGYEHYEISNWSKPGRACAHNLTYWRTRPYLGLGAGAHGFAGGFRYQVVKQPRVYIRRMLDGQPGSFPLSAAAIASHPVTRREEMTDRVITQLRLLKEGLDLNAFANHFGISLNDAFEGEVDRLIKWEMVNRVNGRLLLTKRGRFLSNQVFYRFM